MTGPDSPDCPEDDRGCLRAVLAVPVVLLTAVAAFCCRAALVTRPADSWDRDAFAGIVLACLLTLAAAAAVLGLRLLGRRVLGWAWAAPASAAVAAACWAALG